MLEVPAPFRGTGLELVQLTWDLTAPVGGPRCCARTPPGFVVSVSPTDGPVSLARGNA